MNVLSIKGIENVAKHGQAQYKDLFCANLNDSSNKDPESECLQTMWKCWVTIVPPGITLEPHKHEDHEQIYYILEGSGEVSVGDEKRRVSAGDCIYMPTDVPHGLVNDSDKECRLFTVGANIFRAYMKRKD